MRRGAGGPLAILLGCLLVIAVVAALLAPRSVSDSDPSSRSAGDAGTLALYLWLSRLGLPVERMTGDFVPGRADVLVIAEPTDAITAQQAQDVVAMVRDGGMVILAADRGSLNQSADLLSALGALPDTAGLQEDSSAQPAAFDATAAAPIDPAGLVHTVPMRSGFTFDTRSDSTVTLLHHGDDAVGVAAPLGRGRAYVLSSPYPLSNLGVREKDSAPFLLALIDRARGGHVVFDEVHHGETASGGASAALSGPVGVAGGLAAAAIFAFLLLSGRRLGRPVPATDPARVPSASEYVDALGALIERTAQRGGIADRYAEELKQRVGAASAIDPRLDDATFLGVLEGYDPAAAERVRGVLGRCRNLAAGRPSDAQLVALAREVDEVESLFAVGGAAGLREFRG